jgi:hypothetical protein
MFSTQPLNIFKYLVIEFKEGWVISAGDTFEGISDELPAMIYGTFSEPGSVYNPIFTDIRYEGVIWLVNEFSLYF